MSAENETKYAEFHLFMRLLRIFAAIPLLQARALCRSIVPPGGKGTRLPVSRSAAADIM